MTPDPRNVRDALLEAGHTHEEVERMLRAVDGRIEHALRRYADYVSGRWVASLNGSPSIAEVRHRSTGEWHAVRGELTIACSVIPPLSPVETSTATSTHRPQSETLGCLDCRAQGFPMCGCDGTPTAARAASERQFSERR